MYRHSANSVHQLELSRSTSVNMAELSDRDLIILVQNQHHLAFQQLVKRNQSFIRAYLYQLAPDSSERADLEQEVLLRIWRFIGSLRDPAKFKAWLRQITSNVFYDSLRKRSALKVVSLDESYNEDEESTSRDIADSSAVPEDVMQREELLSEIESALSKLPDQFRTSLILREMHGLSYEEIAKLTHSEKGTVKSRVSRARDKVQNSMSSYLKDCA